mgnify:CR=1 FL=1
MSDKLKTNDTENEQIDSVLDEQWSMLADDWQSQPTPKTDIDKLLKQTQRRTLWAKAIIAIDIVATIGILIGLLYVYRYHPEDTATFYYLVFGFIGSVIFCYFEIKIRLENWSLAEKSPSDAIKNAQNGCVYSIQYIKLIKISCYFMIVGGNWYVYEAALSADKSPWVGMGIISLFMVGMYAVSHWFEVKRKRELARLKALVN